MSLIMNSTWQARGAVGRPSLDSTGTPGSSESHQTPFLLPAVSAPTPQVRCADDIKRAYGRLPGKAQRGTQPDELAGTLDEARMRLDQRGERLRTLQVPQEAGNTA